MFKNCQACGNPIFSANSFGTETDGRLNTDYCSNCYKGGHFFSKDWTDDADMPVPPPMPYMGMIGDYYGAGFWMH